MGKTKIKQLLFVLLMPVISFLLIGIFSFVNLAGNVFADKNGGGFFVGSNTTFNFNATISGSSATNGGGVYIANNGTFNMNGGAIYGNTATTTGNNIYNSGTFNMTGGRVGTSGSSSSGYGVYNIGTMNLYGGNVYDNIYSSANINTKIACNIAGTITLQNGATITVEDYAGTTPNYAINLSNARTAGTILTFVGSSTEPNLSKLNITGYDTDMSKLKTQQDDNGNWTVELYPVALWFAKDWKTQVASTTYMTSTITSADLTSIKFVSSVPSGYTKIGTLSTGLPVYQGTAATEIAFVCEKIYAPEDSSDLFYSRSKLTEIDTSVLDTSKVTNMRYMFGSCSSLTNLDVSKFDTTNVTRMDVMFVSCSKLAYIDVSNFSTTNVTGMSTMFSNCSSLTGLDLSNFNTSKVTDMSRMFFDCTSLTGLDLGSFDTSNVTKMYQMFSGCSNLKSIVTGNYFDTSKVTDMKEMFRSCKNLSNLDTSGFDTSNVTDMYYMFGGCSSLTSLDVSSFDTSKVTNMQNMFSYCSLLTTLNLSGFRTPNVTDMSYLFWYSSKLTNIDISNFDTSKVTNMSYMFLGCSRLTSLDLSTFNMSKVISVTYMLNFGSTDKLKELKTPYNNTTSIPIKTGSTLYNVETGAVVTSVPANTTASKTYATQLTLTFDANGGTCNTTSATAYYNVSLRDSGFVFPYPTKSGYMFSGWYQNTSFVGAKLSLDSVFTTNCKFYAKWEDQNPPSGGGSSNSPCYIGWEETGRPLVNEVSEDIKRYNNNYTLESIDGFVIISEYNSSSFQDYTLVERLNISHLPIQIYIVELNPEGPNASYINCSNCSLIVAIYVQEFAFGISNTWDGVVFDENEQLFRELAPNAIFWDLRGFCTENFKPNDQVDGPTTEQYMLILGRQVQLCILPENFYLGIDWSLSEAGCVVQSYLFEDVTGDYSFVSSKNNDQNEICRDIGIAKISLNFNQEKTIQNILNLNDEKLLETKRKIKLVSNVKKE